MTEQKKIITPNDGKPKKVVDLHNNPISSDPTDQVNVEASMKANIIATLREVADKIEKGELPDPEYIMMLPKFKNGDMSMMYLGAPIPSVVLEGMLHRVLTRMALQG